MKQFDQQRLNSIFNNFSGKKILVIGDLMIDEYLWGNVSRLSPEAPVPIVEIESESLRFGGAANVALNVKTLGCAPLLLGVVGNDRMGGVFNELLNANQMSDAGILKCKNRPTTVKTRIIGDNQHLARVDREHRNDLDDNDEQEMLERINVLMDDVAAVIMEDYNKGLLTKTIINAVLKHANDKGIISTVDPKFKNFLEYKRATVFKPNIREAAQALARHIDTETDITEAGKALLEMLEASCILLTRGAKGITIFEHEGEISTIPAKTRKVADVSGAGDTVISTLTAALTGGATFKEAALLANYAAGLVCEEVGIVPVQADLLKKEVLSREIRNAGNS